MPEVHAAPLCVRRRHVRAQNRSSAGLPRRPCELSERVPPGVARSTPGIHPRRLGRRTHLRASRGLRQPVPATLCSTWATNSPTSIVTTSHAGPSRTASVNDSTLELSATGASRAHDNAQQQPSRTGSPPGTRRPPSCRSGAPSLGQPPSFGAHVRARLRSGEVGNRPHRARRVGALARASMTVPGG